MTGSIILTENNLSPSGLFDPLTNQAPFNRFTQNLRGISLQGRRIGLKKMTMYYSWSNIRSNTSITIQWRVGASFNSYVWTLPANTNYASVDELNESLQTFCIANGLYLVNNSGQNVYYIELKANPSTYKIDLNLYLVPTSLPASWTQPPNFVGYPSVSNTPRFIIPNPSEMIRLIGYTAGTYQGGATPIGFSSAFVPQLSPVSCVYMTCNIAKNDTPINGSTVIAVFTTRDTPYGAMIEVEPATMSYYDVDYNSTELIVEFYDQDFNRLFINDPRTTIQLETI